MKDILIHVRDGELRPPAARFGVGLAANLGAAVTAVYACPERRYAAPMFSPELLTAHVLAWASIPVLLRH